MKPLLYRMSFFFFWCTIALCGTICLLGNSAHVLLILFSKLRKSSDCIMHYGLDPEHWHTTYTCTIWCTPAVRQCLALPLWRLFLCVCLFCVRGRDMPACACTSRWPCADMLFLSIHLSYPSLFPHFSPSLSSPLLSLPSPPLPSPPLSLLPSPFLT